MNECGVDMKILCVGMMVCDVLISPVPQDVLSRDSVSISKPVTACGGDALNVAVGLAKLGMDTAIVGRLAEDASGAFIRSACAAVGLDTSGVVIDRECATATTYALIDESGERHFLTDKAIFSRLVNEDVTDAQLQWADIVYFGSAMALPAMNDGGLARLFRRAKAMGKTTIMDAAIDDTLVCDDWLQALAPALQYTDIFFPSIDEARLITGKENPEEIAECFRPFGMKALGIKLGSKGCYVTDFETASRIPAVSGLTVVDTTGAGDSFVAGFICALAKGWSIPKSAAFANTVGAQSVTRIGGTSGIPSFREALAYYEKWVQS